jgi:hypothetical protein
MDVRMGGAFATVSFDLVLFAEVSRILSFVLLLFEVDVEVVLLTVLGILFEVVGLFDVSVGFLEVLVLFFGVVGVFFVASEIE